MMPQAEFSLNTTDKIRLLKDRLFRLSVSFGGMSVLGALVLIFVYLLWVVIPLFSDAELDLQQVETEISETAAQSFVLDDHGRYAFSTSQQGNMVFWNTQISQPQPTWQRSLGFKVSQVIFSSDQQWQLLIGEHNQLALIKPKFTYSSDGKNQFQPQVESIVIGSKLQAKFADWGRIDSASLSVSDDAFTIAAIHDHGQLDIISQPIGTDADLQDVRQFRFPAQVGAQQLVLSPEAQSLYLRSGNELVVIKKSLQGFHAREVIDLSQGIAERKAVDMVLLAGGYSLLVTYTDGTVSQWFDVLSDEQRRLTHIRDFHLSADIASVFPNRYSKGFFVLHNNGMLHNFYTTSEKLVLFERVASKAPQLAALSANEKHLLLYRQDGEKGYLKSVGVDMGHPEISFSSLWQKVWYEGYSEPDYVWQSTSASDSFEAKFSLVPIAFGTLKAAFYSLLFAIPVAVFAAIYTAYFMSPKMRRVVKPTIELMEALPTVIIGFLAGLWFAPIVEQHLISVLLMIFLLPISTIIAGFIWSFLPKRWDRSVGRGWHAVALIPVLAIAIALIFPLSFDIETWLFDGDVRTFLAQHGMDFDQRNALVVGLAMGFAVIPTIFTIAEDAVFSVPKHLSDGSLALGATAWQTLIYVVLLTASPGIFSAIMMGIGRAVGETMIVLMATGNTPVMDFDLLEGMRTLAANIAVELPESEVGSSHYRILFLAALILFVFTFLVNSVAEWVRLRLREKYRAL